MAPTMTIPVPPIISKTVCIDHLLNVPTIVPHIIIAYFIVKVNAWHKRFYDTMEAEELIEWARRSHGTKKAEK